MSAIPTNADIFQLTYSVMAEAEEAFREGDYDRAVENAAYAHERAAQIGASDVKARAWAVLNACQFAAEEEAGL
jgi:hypothetical protein